MIKIGVLSINENHDNASLLQYFAEFEKNYNAKSIIIDPKFLEFGFNGNNSNEKEKYLYYNGKKIKIDVILPRIDSDVSHKDFMVAVNAMDFIRNHTDIPVINYTKGMLISNDKFWQGEYIAAHGYKTPRTSLLSSTENIPKVLKDFNNKYPLIVKSQFGAGGAGVAIVESERSAKSVISSMILNGTSVVVQDYLPVEGGTDYRLFVVGNKVVKGIIRTAPSKDFRANVALGGSKKYFKPSRELRNVAVDIANIVGLEIAAVDFMFYNNQYYFIEINKNPGTKKDPKTAKIVLEYTIERSKKKIKKVKTTDKRYLIKSVKSVNRVFKDLDINLVGLGKRAFLRFIPAFLMENYHILSYAQTNDYDLLSKYAKIKNISDKDFDFINYNAYLHSRDIINYAHIENYLRKLSNVHLLVYNPDDEITENIISQISSSVVYANKINIRRRFSNNIRFREFLEKNKIKIAKNNNYSFKKFYKTGYRIFSKIFGNEIVVKFPANTPAQRSTFIVKNKQDFSNIKKVVRRQKYRYREIQSVDVFKYIEGKNIAINCCITEEGVILGNIGQELVDINQVYNKNTRFKGKNCGITWIENGLSDKVIYNLKKSALKIGNLIRKKSKYKGLLALEYVVDKNKEAYPVGCKTYQTDSMVLEDLINIKRKLVPMEAFQLLESFGVNYSYDYKNLSERYFSKKNEFTLLKLFNIKGKPKQLKGNVKAGIYKFDTKGNFKFEKESIDLSDIKKNNFAVIESITSKDLLVEVQDEDSKIMSLIFSDNIFNKSGILKDKIQKITDKIYKKLYYS